MTYEAVWLGCTFPGCDVGTLADPRHLANLTEDDEAPGEGDSGGPLRKDLGAWPDTSPSGVFSRDLRDGRPS